MFGEYAEAAKAFLINFRYVFLAVAVIGSIWAIDNNGYSRCDNKWKSEEKDKEILATNTLAAMNQKVTESNEQSARLAQQMEAMGNKHETELNDLHNDLVNARTHGVQRSTLCTGRSATKSTKNSGTGTVIESAADTTALSDEFEEFLVSLTRRADEAGIYAEVAHDWITELCKDKEQFVCIGLN